LMLPTRSLGARVRIKFVAAESTSSHLELLHIESDYRRLSAEPFSRHCIFQATRLAALRVTPLR
jgi:hypothetical protein